MNEELFQYLSDEYMECVKKEESLIQKKYELEGEKRKFEESVSFHLEDEKRRQLFSPLYLKDANFQKDRSYDKFELSEAGQKLQQCGKELEKIDEKKQKLKEFMHSLNETSLKINKMEEEEKIPFFPAFHELVKLTQKLLSKIEIDYDEEEIITDNRITLGFLWSWKKLFQYLSESLLLSYILINTFVEKDHLMIGIECISNVPLGNQAKNGLEKVLQKEAFIHSWNDNTFEINIKIKS